MDFEHAGRPEEELTEERNEGIERLIKNRIIEEEWDDPVRIEAPKDKKYKVKEDVSTEKSSVGLAEVYER